MSGEHVFSEGLFSDQMISAQGVRGIGQRVPSQVSRKSLKAKVLCTTHNSQLSELDAEAKKLYDALRRHLRVQVPGRSRVQVDGWKIERWCMKCGHNLLASKWVGARPYVPDPSMVNIVFGGTNLPADAGLYVVKKPEIRLSSDADRIGWFVMQNSENEADIKGFYFQLFGLGLFITAHRGDPAPALRLVRTTDNALDWSTAELTHRPIAMDVNFWRKEWQTNETACLTIEFGW